MQQPIIKIENIFQTQRNFINFIKIMDRETNYACAFEIVEQYLKNIHLFKDENKMKF